MERLGSAADSSVLSWLEAVEIFHFGQFRGVDVALRRVSEVDILTCQPIPRLVRGSA